MKKIHLDVDPYIGSKAEPFVALLRQECSFVPASKADEVFVLGGDGALNDSIRRHYQFGIPFFGFNFGHVGFRLNSSVEAVLREVLEGEVQYIQGRMLQARVSDSKGSFGRDVLAFQDFYFERTRIPTANFRVMIDGVVRSDPMMSDGIIVAAPAGSTAYNASAGGKIIPLDSKLLIVTGICPAIFSEWRSLLLSEDSVVEIEALNVKRRPVRLLADGILVPKATRALISCATETVTLGFALSENFREKVLNAQFNCQHAYIGNKKGVTCDNKS